MPGGCSRPSIPTRLVRSRICLPFSKAIRRSGFPCRRVPPSGSGWRVRSSAIRLPLQEGRKARPIGIEQSCVLVGGPEGPNHVSSPRCARSRLPPLPHRSWATCAIVHDSFAVVGGPEGPTHVSSLRCARSRLPPLLHHHDAWQRRGFRRSYNNAVWLRYVMFFRRRAGRPDQRFITALCPVAASAAPTPRMGGACVASRPRPTAALCRRHRIKRRMSPKRSSPGSFQDWNARRHGC